MKHLDFVIWVIGWIWFLMTLECVSNIAFAVRLIGLIIWVAVAITLWNA